jgi:ubiquinone/menaquinone biosynthesis C-methylase UbiE
MIRGVLEVRDAYRSTAVARDYVRERFKEPIGALLHDRQVQAVVSEIEQRRPARILEIAPGPARVTVDVARRVSKRWTLVDASRQMLEQARQALGDGGWPLLQGDAFALPVQGNFDLVYSFRFIRHFDSADRRRLYAEIHRLLRPGGALIFDAVNEFVSGPLRRESPSEYPVYDALLRPKGIRAELQEAGFCEVALEGVQRRYRTLCALQKYVAPRSRTMARGAMEVVDALPGGEPLEWIVTCRRK